MEETVHGRLQKFINDMDYPTFAKMAGESNYDEEVGLTTPAEVAAFFLGDLNRCKREMQRIAKDNRRISSILKDQKLADDQSCMQLDVSLCIKELILETIHFFAARHRQLEKCRNILNLRLHGGGHQEDHRKKPFIPANWKENHARSREAFLNRAQLQPPEVLRVIDIEATSCRSTSGRVVLIDYWADGVVQQVGYSAISHTYGMDVYEVFNCQCASEMCTSTKVRPRCWLDKPCPHHSTASSAIGAAGCEKHNRVVKDILTMCGTLWKGGVKYAWHDGVCIAQHDELEVEETIMHMGWIYANANETIIFLQYVGNPMAPIRDSNFADELVCRWHTRVWTLQEAAFSKCRRYCTKVESLAPLDCLDFGSQVQNTRDDQLAVTVREVHGGESALPSSTITIMEEEMFFECLMKTKLRLISRIRFTLTSLRLVTRILGQYQLHKMVQLNWEVHKTEIWLGCINSLLDTLAQTCFVFPTVENALYLCTRRDSKHEGDRINSILALAEVKDFVAPKDVNVGASTMEFFKRQGQRGLERALLSINVKSHNEGWQTYINEVRHRGSHTWLPILWRPLLNFQQRADYDVRYRVLENDGSMELRGKLNCVKVRCTIINHPRAKISSEMPAILYRSTSSNIWDSYSYLPMDLFISSEMTQDICYTATRSVSPYSVIGNAYISHAINKGGSPEPELIGLEKGECFDAHLVQMQDSEIGRLWPTVFLIVQGDLHARVSKIGIFVAKPGKDFFLRKLLEYGPFRASADALTTRKRLIII